jgi:photosystem II stability/assembly factor-like uncharacterized protein
MTDRRDLDLKMALNALDARQVPPAAPDWDAQVLAALGARPAQSARPAPGTQRLRPHRLGLRLLVAACLALAVFVFLSSGAGAWVGLPNLPNPLGFVFHRTPPHKPAPLPSSPAASPSPSSPSATAKPSPTSRPSPTPTRSKSASIVVPPSWPLDTDASHRGWQRRSSGTTANLMTVDFVGNDGWAVGSRGTILATTDGGATWAKRTSGYHGWLADVAFADREHGWTVGGNQPSGATVLATTDGGATWQTQTTAKTSLAAVFAVDSTHAWAVGHDSRGRGRVLATTDGRTWHEQHVGRRQFLVDVSFTDEKHGWAVGIGGTIVATRDGGTTWAAQQSHSDAYLSSVHFVDSAHGWAAGTQSFGSGSRAVVLATSDGGARWKLISIGSRYTTIFRMTFADRLHGWAVASYGPRLLCLATRNGGVSWRTVKVMRPPGLEDVGALSSGRACFVGYPGLIYTLGSR